MRKISAAKRHHNHAAAWLAGGLALGLLAGCGGGEQQTASRATGSVQQATGCALVVSDEGLVAFYDLADRVAAGEDVTVEAMATAVAQPVWDRWRRSFEPQSPAASRVGRTLFIALRSRDELPERLRDKAAPSDLVGSYEMSLEHRDLITSYVADFVADEIGCGVFAVLDHWLDPAAMPDTLRVDFLVGHPEIRFYEDHLMLDAGLAWAAGREQLVRFLASVVYRDLAAIDGRDPDKARGPAIILETLRLVRNEAIPACIDDMIDVTFDPRHRLLAGASAVPDELCLQAQRTLISLDSSLGHVRSLDAATDEDWLQLYRLFVGARSVTPTGWYMAQVIERRFGHERLLAANRSVADLFATYQEAALLSPAAPESAPGTLDWHLEAAPRFTAENARWLDEQLRRLFP